MSYTKPVRVTGDAVQKNIALQREFDTRQRQLEAFSKESANLLSAANAQTKIETQRRLLTQQVCRTEQQQEKDLRLAQHEKKFRELTISQNQALANELDKDAADVERRTREIQKICEEAPELKDLEAQLKIAYLNKERAAQYEEKVLLAAREQERNQAIEDEIEFQRITALQREAAGDEDKKAFFEEDRRILERQIAEREEQRREAQRQVERDREMVDTIILRIQKEDEDERVVRRQKQAESADMVRAFEVQRKEEVAAKKAAAQAEEDYINAYNKSMEMRNQGVAAQKAAKKEAEEKAFNAIVEASERKRKEEEEFNNLRDMLWEEELEAKRSADSQGRIDKQKGMRKEMMAANEQMLEQKVKFNAIQAEKEAQMLTVMRRKFAADDAKERADEDARKSNKMHHMTLVEKQRIERKDMYEAERAQEYAFIDENNRREEYRKKVVMEARKRLLEEHAQQLSGFLPRKAFDNEGEYDAFKTASEAQRYNYK